MKKRTINIITVIALFWTITFTSCLKTDSDEIFQSPPAAITGDFEGEFIMLQKKLVNSGYDTLVKDIIHIRLRADSGFTISGDTTHHAASHGAFKNENFIQFIDMRYDNKSTKRQLHGLYNYYYDGQKLQILRSYADTLGILYDLRRK
ncbi:MAG: hypothetical protein EOP46_07405 [Sphingobacteriaceae bacterium]|nr:MAG: hypothetical protein EOP46_07405 [Sphingobacteriaceae bacterium]